MRILNESAGILTLEQLGFTSEQQEVVKRNMDKPYGMIIASGPTGSGKTTTLYSFLSLLHTKTQNVVTLEDPVESGLERVNQSQVRPDLNFTFATGLRALLRQDPDVILVGEIRDVETVSMAAQASMTGHLVLTSLHTNDAVGAFARFAEMGVDDFLTASVINLVVAQRLVRTLCTHCSKKEKLDPVIVKRIKERPDLCDALKVENPDVLADLGSREFETKVGCDECMESGYRGRIGLFELLEMNKDLHDLILTRASSDKMQDVALKHGFETMVVQGVRRVLAGQTTFDEVLRVTREA
jgi:general secretion pathway protein E